MLLGLCCAPGHATAARTPTTEMNVAELTPMDPLDEIHRLNQRDTTPAQKEQILGHLLELMSAGNLTADQLHLLRTTPGLQLLTSE